MSKGLANRRIHKWTDRHTLKDRHTVWANGLGKMGGTDTRTDGQTPGGLMDVMGQDRIGYAGMGDLTYCILIPHTPRQVTRLLEDLVVATGLPARALCACFLLR